MPWALVKRMSTVPVPGGETAVIWVDEFWVKLAAGVSRRRPR